MGAKNTLASIVLGAILTLTPGVALAQKPQAPKVHVFGGQQLEKVIANHHGSDNEVIFQNKKDSVVILGTETNGYQYHIEAKLDYKGEKDTIIVEENEVYHLIEKKNYFVLDTPEDAMIKIANSRAPNHYSKMYFQLSTENFPRPQPGSGKVVTGKEEEWYLSRKKAVETVIDKFKKEGKDTYELETILRDITAKLGSVSGATDLKPGLYKSKYVDSNNNTIELILVSIEYKAIILEGHNRPSVRNLTQDALTSYINDTLHKDVKKIYGIPGLEILDTKENFSMVSNQKYLYAKVVGIYTKVNNQKLTNELLERIQEATIDWNQYPQMKRIKKENID